MGDDRRSAWIRRIKDFRRGAGYARRLLREPIAPARAVRNIAGRVAGRAETLLDTLERAVYAHPPSPYRPLLEAAGYDFPRLRRLVVQMGVEGALLRLAAAGVFVSIEEFKGLRGTRRSGREFHFTEEAFRNPLAPAGLTASSGGTRSQGIPTTISAENHLMGAEHLAAAMAAYGLEGARTAVWLPQAHGASLWAVLAFAAVGSPPSRWFTQLPGRFGSTVESFSYYGGIKVGARLRGIALPGLTYVPFGQERMILRWTGHRRQRGGCLIFTTPSSALRLALASGEAATDLSTVTFITIGEPLTPAKHAAIARAGARAFSSLGFTEFGRATYGCALSNSPDETHICRDALAVVQHRRSVDQLGSEVDALLFTTLQPTARRILLNVETGDYASLTVRDCGCPLNALGWTERLEQIRSFEKLNAEGLLFFGAQVITLIEEILPARFGGDATDYQLIESEDPRGFTALSVLAHPRLGEIDDDALLDCVVKSLGQSSWSTAAVWKALGTLRVRREVPILTRAGKLMPLHRLGPVQR